MTEIKPYPVDASYNQTIVLENKTSPEDVSTYGIVKATQYGILPRCIQIIESGYDVNDMDSENVSLLHWAAINNREEIVKYYLSKGANIDVRGGELQSTPLHWAVRQGLLDMVALLLKYGASPSIVDGQGLACIHVAAQLACTNIVAYLLANGVSVDSTDANGMSALMWGSARSSGPDPARLLITWGANVNIQDAKGCTAGHYAAMGGNYVVIGLLDKAGIDWNLINKDGATVHQALVKKNMTWVSDRLSDMMIARGQRRHKNYFRDLIASNKLLRTVMMGAMPPLVFLCLGMILHMALNYWLKLLLLALIFLFVRFGMRFFVDSRAQILTMFSLATATTFFLCISYIYFLIPYNTRVINTVFLCSISVLWYNFMRAYMRDPGYIKINPSERVSSILSMVCCDPSKKVTLDRFCTTCLIRKPLRSKHCAVCDRCVAKFDHHCPWIYNCVGANTISNFIVYLLSLIPSLSLFAYGALSYWLHLHTINTTDSVSLIIYKFLVDVFHINPWILFCTINSLAYLLWVSLLFFAQVYQAIWLNQTTNERINWERFSTVHTPHLNEQNCKDNCSHTKDKSSNPYYMGLKKNFFDLFQSKRFSIDWTDVFTLNDFNSQVHKTGFGRSTYERV